MKFRHCNKSYQTGSSPPAIFNYFHILNYNKIYLQPLCSVINVLDQNAVSTIHTAAFPQVRECSIWSSERKVNKILRLGRNISYSVSNRSSISSCSVMIYFISIHLSTTRRYLNLITNPSSFDKFVNNAM